ncbi:hypothetical protein Z043_125744 [Scleropages formosus]|uniref:Uncharacterized protein n=1 Tax=Scleropages formosus TaxID=113540 RepID=A0A0P7W6Q1_SCLFO|nr:hypothetical protein Z043_125744 [Scleropages formosus]
MCATLFRRRHLQLILLLLLVSQERTEPPPQSQVHLHDNLHPTGSGVSAKPWQRGEWQADAILDGGSKGFAGKCLRKDVPWRPVSVGAAARNGRWGGTCFGCELFCRMRGVRLFCRAGGRDKTGRDKRASPASGTFTDGVTRQTSRGVLILRNADGS